VRIMKTIEGPGAVAALGASVIDQLGRRVIPEGSRQQSLKQAPITTAPKSVPERRTAHAGAKARLGTPEQRNADIANAQEFHQIQKFVAACRRRWPGAMIVLRPDGASSGANTPIQHEARTRSK
jgi:hypothetical protein